MSEYNEALSPASSPGSRSAKVSPAKPKKRPTPSFLEDLGETWRRRRLVTRLAWEDIAKRYRGSVLGPFWVTVSLAVKVGTLSAVYPGVLGADWRAYVPFMAVGFIVWNFIFGMISEGAHGLISAAPTIRQHKLPYTLYVVQLVLRNVIVLLHTLVVYVVIAVLMQIKVSWDSLALIPAMLLLAYEGFWIAMLIGIMCLRYRDLPEFVNSIMLIFFFTTPIFWMPNAQQLEQPFIKFNPFFHAINIIRAPLFGDPPPLTSWAFLAICAIIGTVLTTYVFRATRTRIAFWA